jgi:hypothetical protein
MGINSLLQQNMQGAGLAGIDRLASNAMYPQSQQVNTQFATPSQMPTSAEVVNAGYEPKLNAYTGMPVQNFADGGIARLAVGGSAEEKQATIADLYKKLLGRDPSEGEDIMQWNDYLGEGSPSEILSLANRLAQTEEGAAYGKSEGNKVFSNMVELTQKDSPFAGTENPYSNMKFLGEEKDAEGNPLYRFQDQNSGLMTVDANGQPIKYEPGAGWYDEQLRNRQDALRGMDYRNQTYLASDPLEQTYNFQGVDVPIEATEYQVDPTTGQFVKGATGENVPLRFRDPDYNMWNDWAAPVALLAIPAAAYAASAYGVGAAGAGVGTGAGTAGTAAGTGLTGGVGGSTGILGGTSAAGFGGAGSATGIAGTQAAAGLGVGSGSALAGTGAAMGGGLSTVGSLSPALPAAGSVGGAGTGLSAQLAPGTILGTGLPGGGSIGSSYMLGANGLPATNMFGSPIVASSVGVGGVPATTGMTAQQARIAKMALDMLTPGNGGQQPTGYAIPTASAPATIPTVNRFGVTGYEGQLPTAEVMQRPILLSKIKGVGGDYTFAEGGIATLGSYSDGGQLLKGPGDGMSDNIPAKIGEAQPARLADGEFVIPADVVSHLGNGSTDAGAKQLYSMMDKIRKARTGNKKQGKQINPSKFLP